MEAGRAEEVGSSGKVNLSKKVVRAFLAAEAAAVKERSGFCHQGGRVLGRAIKVCANKARAINVCAIKVCAIKACAIKAYATKVGVVEVDPELCCQGEYGFLK